jgi:hypothetical protein
VTFNQSAVLSLFNSAVSDIQQLGVFETVNQHEPKSAPQNGFVASVWMDSIMPVGRASGIAATSGVVTLMIRCYSSMLLQPVDNIDPGLMTAVATVLNAFSTGYTFSGTVRDVDLLGMYGRSLSAQAGYISIDNKMFRVMTITVPVVINDMFSQEA